MQDKVKNITVTVVMCVIILGLSIFCWVKPQEDFSLSERRNLKKFPEITVKTIFDGNFMKNFESYTLDQFPLRDSFRSLKAFTSNYIFNRSDNNGIYKADGYLSKVEYPYNPDSVDRVTSRFSHIYNKYLKNTNTKNYLSIIPDKNYFLASQNGYLKMDYDRLVKEMKNNTGYLKYIDIFDTLTLDSFYKTDTHWRQEKLQKASQQLLLGMNTYVTSSYTQSTLKNTFYGVYHGQSALNVPGEKLKYLENEATKNAIVFDHQNNKKIPVYNMEKADGKDPYEMFLSGPLSLVTIENPKAKTDKELIIFRDSFGSSLAPLFIDSYKKITLIDIRYMHPDMIGNFVEFNNQDVLFIYSTLVLNNGETFK